MPLVELVNGFDSEGFLMFSGYSIGTETQHGFNITVLMQTQSESYAKQS